MIYIKRLWFCIAMLITIIFAILLYLISIVTISIWATVYYVITGRDPISNCTNEFIFDSGWKLVDIVYDKCHPEN